MHWYTYAAYFFGGAFFCNAIPHLVQGVSGRSFQTPFAKPPGKGLSSATVNVLWGFFNLLVAWLLLLRVGNLDLHRIEPAAATGMGMLLMLIMSARIFGPLHGGE